MITTLRTKMLIGVMPVLALMVGLGLWAITLFSRLGNNIEIILRENYRSVLAAQGMKESLERMDSALLFAIGGALTLVRSTDEMLNVVATLPVGIQTTRTLWEIKAIGLAVIFVYAFFKFAWSYRLYNYVAILLGATPFTSEKDTPETETHVLRTARLFTSAGRHFNRGQRAFFFSLAYLGWFAGPLVFMATTIAVLVVMWRRQFASDSLRAVADHAD